MSVRLLSLLAFLATGPTPTIPAQRTSGPIQIDGKIDEAAWQAAPVVTSFTQQRPREGEAATLRTEVRVLYDDAALYVAMRATDAPDSIVSQLARRDQNVYSDWLSVIIDGYQDRQNAFLFAMNPAGVKRDGRITDDSNEDDSWDAVWSGAVSRDADGWSAEFRIPFSQLRYNRRPGGNWGINFARLVARRDEQDYWAPIQANSQLFVSKFGTLTGIPSLASPEHAEVLPYSVAKLTNQPGNQADPFYRNHALNEAAGADVKIAVTPSLTLNATINPDFGQVEADPSVVNLSDYETFYPEQRPFFVEGAQLFTVNGPQMFYSRRIGRAPQGFAPAGAAYVDMPGVTTILGAAKLTGRTQSGWSVGLMQAFTGAEQAAFVNAAQAHATTTVEPATSYTVARLSHDFGEGRSRLGVLITSVHRDINSNNLLFLRKNAFTFTLDGQHRFGNYALSGVLANSVIEGDTSAIARVQRGAGHYFQRPDADYLNYDPARTSLSGMFASAKIGKVAGGHWRWSSTTQRYSPGFEINDIGFNGSNDRLNEFASLDYYSTKPSRLFQQYHFRADEYWNFTTNGMRIEDMHEALASLQFHNFWGFDVDVMRHEGGRTPDATRGGPSLINPGRYMANLDMTTDERRPVSFMLSYFFDYLFDTASYTNQIAPMVMFRPSARANFSLAPSYTQSLDEGQYVSTRTVNGQAHYIMSSVLQKTFSVDLRANYTFTPTLSLQVYAEPFIGSGSYFGYKEVSDPHAATFAQQFRLLTPDEMKALGVGDPSFNLKQLRSTSLLRWEYRPGSAIFLVWAHDRNAFDPNGSFELSRDLSRLANTMGRNVVQLKATYRIGI